MSPFWNYMSRMNLFFAVAIVFVLHLVFYLSIHARNWLLATLAATITYGVLFGALRAYARHRQRGSV